VDEKVTSHSIEMLVAHSASFLSCIVFELNKRGIPECLQLAVRSIDCVKNCRIQWFGLRVLCDCEKKTMSVPADIFEKIIQILMENDFENEILAARFFFRFSVSRNDEFLALGEPFAQICLQKLASLDGSSRLADYLIGVIIQFPLSPEALAVVLVHFPVVTAWAVFDRVYQWVLQQLEQNPEAVPILLNSILRLFCLNLQRLVERGKIGKEVLLMLTAALDGQRANPLLSAIATEIAREDHSALAAFRRGLVFAEALGAKDL
jgi:hypothetical protein